MADVKVTSNASDIAGRVLAAKGEIEPEAERLIAEAAVAFLEELRGPQALKGSRPDPKGDAGREAGRTPFKTGNLLSRGKVRQKGLALTFRNNARQYSTAGSKFRIKSGSESYADWAHKVGAPTGQYAADADGLFQKHFDDALKAKLEAAIARKLAV